MVKHCRKVMTVWLRLIMCPNEKILHHEKISVYYINFDLRKHM